METRRFSVSLCLRVKNENIMVKNSLPQRITLMIIHTAAVILVGWLLLGDGLTLLAGRFGDSWLPGDELRRQLIFAGSLIYLLRLFFTTFVLLKRDMPWNEVAAVGPWLWVIHLTFALLGGPNSQPNGVIDLVAIALYLFGSYLNTGSEYLRLRWKRHPENKGKLYTGGLFKYSMHINYFGDVVLFSGLALLTHSPYAFIIPLLMAASFIFFHIPNIDSYLAEKYSPDFQRYAQQTKKLIPFVY